MRVCACSQLYVQLRFVISEWKHRSVFLSCCRGWTLGWSVCDSSVWLIKLHYLKHKTSDSLNKYLAKRTENVFFTSQTCNVFCFLFLMRSSDKLVLVEGISWEYLWRKPVSGYKTLEFSVDFSLTCTKGNKGMV